MRHSALAKRVLIPSGRARRGPPSPTSVGTLRSGSRTLGTRNLAETWANPGIRPETRAQVIHAVHERIEVRGLDFAGVKVTPEAYAHGLALALPERVSRVRAGLACPRGLDGQLATTRTVRTPILRRNNGYWPQEFHDD